MVKRTKLIYQTVFLLFFAIAGLLSGICLFFFESDSSLYFCGTLNSFSDLLNSHSINNVLAFAFKAYFVSALPFLAIYLFGYTLYADVISAICLLWECSVFSYFFTGVFFTDAISKNTVILFSYIFAYRVVRILHIYSLGTGSVFFKKLFLENLSKRNIYKLKYYILQYTWHFLFILGIQAVSMALQIAVAKCF